MATAQNTRENTSTSFESRQMALAQREVMIASLHILKDQAQAAADAKKVEYPMSYNRDHNYHAYRKTMLSISEAIISLKSARI